MAAPTLKIDISSPQPAYTAGDIIRGKVVLIVPNDQSIGIVAIGFIGRGKTKLNRSNGNNRRIYRGRAPLFAYKQVLYQGHYTVKASTYSWDFQFQFPTHTDPSCVEDRFSQDGIWLGTGTIHLLPPSFKYYDNHSRNQGMVEYKLEAEMEKAKSGFFESKLAATADLMYIPPRTDPNPEFKLYLQEQQFRPRTLKLLPDKQQLTFREKMHTVFKASELPTAAFIVRMIYPTITFSDRLLPIHLGIVSMVTSEEVPEQPIVILSSITVKIKSTYHVRAASLWDPTGIVDEEQHLFTNLNMKTNLPIVDIPSKTTPIPSPHIVANDTDQPTDAYLELSKLTRFGLRTPAMCPTFSTINVAIRHRLKVKMRLECAGKSYSVDMSDALDVVSPSPDAPVRRHSSVGHGASAHANVTGQLLEDENHQLPAYTARPPAGTTILDAAHGGPNNLPPAYAPNSTGGKGDEKTALSKIEEGS